MLIKGIAHHYGEFQIANIQTFLPLVLGLALGTTLIPLPPLVLVARHAHGKSTHMARHEKLSAHRSSHSTAADLAHLASLIL